MANRSSMFDLSGKVALITGSTKGIGRSIAEEMAKAGARVVISSRKADVVHAVADELKAQGYEALAVPANVSSKEAMKHLVDTTVREWGQIDVLVGNAASNPYYGPLLDIGDEAFDKIMATNVRSNLWLCQLAMPAMAERRNGCVILVSSIAAVRATTTLGAYAISKAADVSLIRCLALEYGPKNVRVNAILPGLVKTDFARALWEDPERLKRVENQTPLRRIGDPKDIGGVAVFLASEAAAFITGQAIIADGGDTIA